jgi:hypothetical protein
LRSLMVTILPRMAEFVDRPIHDGLWEVEPV